MPKRAPKRLRGSDGSTFSACAVCGVRVHAALLGFHQNSGDCAPAPQPERLCSSLDATRDHPDCSVSTLALPHVSYVADDLLSAQTEPQPGQEQETAALRSQLAEVRGQLRDAELKLGSVSAELEHFRSRSHLFEVEVRELRSQLAEELDRRRNPAYGYGPRPASSPASLVLLAGVPTVTGPTTPSLGFKYDPSLPAPAPSPAASHHQINGLSPVAKLRMEAVSGNVSLANRSPSGQQPSECPASSPRSPHDNCASSDQTTTALNLASSTDLAPPPTSAPVNPKLPEMVSASPSAGTPALAAAALEAASHSAPHANARTVATPPNSAPLADVAALEAPSHSALRTAPASIIAGALPLTPPVETLSQTSEGGRRRLRLLPARLFVGENTVHTRTATQGALLVAQPMGAVEPGSTGDTAMGSRDCGVSKKGLYAGDSSEYVAEGGVDAQPKSELMRATPSACGALQADDAADGSRRRAVEGETAREVAQEEVDVIWATPSPPRSEPQAEGGIEDKAVPTTSPVVRCAADGEPQALRNVAVGTGGEIAVVASAFETQEEEEEAMEASYDQAITATTDISEDDDDWISMTGRLARSSPTPKAPKQLDAAQRQPLHMADPVNWKQPYVEHGGMIRPAAQPPAEGATPLRQCIEGVAPADEVGLSPSEKPSPTLHREAVEDRGFTALQGKQGRPDMQGPARTDSRACSSMSGAASLPRMQSLDGLLEEFRTDDDLCLASVCALNRHHQHKAKQGQLEGIPSSLTETRTLATWITGGGAEGAPARTAAEARVTHPSLVERCRSLALNNADQLWEIYASGDDVHFLLL
ncbi:hypothetical protein CYMTET_6769 [Cymbomonas tetramitiformis]|uniref:Uncharacterized protein n=1 Tax=Cymbomonas tetramitiformis TaxID=36881 RepID=A0AAE0GWF3_9CHLO|nr:hypothetical protein CYMTET_6769 [Cymbomonas tetramitiformis]